MSDERPYKPLRRLRRKRDSAAPAEDHHYRAWREPLIEQKRQAVAEAEAQQAERLAKIGTGYVPRQSAGQRWTQAEIAYLRVAAAELGAEKAAQLARLVAPVLGRSFSSCHNAIRLYRVLDFDSGG